MATIFLNEGTEIEVKESKAEIRELIRESIEAEKWGDYSHFIEVTMIKTEYKYWAFFFGKSIPVPQESEVKADLYFKRILFIYD